MDMANVQSHGGWSPHPSAELQAPTADQHAHAHRTSSEPLQPSRLSYAGPYQPPPMPTHRHTFSQTRPTTVWGQLPPHPHPPIPTLMSPSLSSPGAGPSHAVGPWRPSTADDLRIYSDSALVPVWPRDEKLALSGNLGRQPTHSYPRLPPKPEHLSSSSASSGPPSHSSSPHWSLGPPTYPPPVPEKDFVTAGSFPHPSHVPPPPPPLPPKLLAELRRANPFDDAHEAAVPNPVPPPGPDGQTPVDEDEELSRILRLSAESYEQDEMRRRNMEAEQPASEDEAMRQAIAMSLAQAADEQREAFRQLAVRSSARPTQSPTASSSRSPDPPGTAPSLPGPPASAASPNPRLTIPTAPPAQTLIASPIDLSDPEHGWEETPLPLYEEVVGSRPWPNPASPVLATPSLTSSTTPISSIPPSRHSSMRGFPSPPMTRADALAEAGPSSRPRSPTVPVITPPRSSLDGALSLSRSTSTPSAGSHSGRPEGSSPSTPRLRNSRSSAHLDAQTPNAHAAHSSSPVPPLPPPAQPTLPAMRMPEPEPVSTTSEDRLLHLEKEYSEGVSFGYSAPLLDQPVLPPPPPVPRSIYIHPDSAFHICAPSWHDLLRLLARLGDITVYPAPEAFQEFPDVNEMSVRLVLHFHKCRYGGAWKSTLWIDLVRRLPDSLTPGQAWPYVNGDTTVAPYRSTIPRDSGVYFQRPDSSITYVLPPRLSPTLPLRMDVVASILGDAYRTSRASASTGTITAPPGSLAAAPLDVGLSIRRLSKAVDKCYPRSEGPTGGVIDGTKGNAGEIFVGKRSFTGWLRSGVGSVLGTSSSKGGKYGNDENYDLVTPFTG